MRVYGWIGGDRPQDVAAEAEAARAAGLTAVKMNATAELHYLDSEARVEEAAERLAAARSSGLDVAVDFHGRVHRAMAKRLVRALEPHSPLFLEEPVLPEHPEALREIARLTCVPIACGERLYTRWGFKDVLTSGAVDVIQPDLSHAGGLLETRKIAAMAEAYDVAVAPHCPLGPIALAASLQLDACTPNAVIQELSLRMHYNDGADLLDYVVDGSVFDVVDGHIAVPGGLGLGVEIDEERVRAAAGAEPWHSPVWRNDDGTVAEW
jgi:galactonate dehydratase